MHQECSLQALRLFFNMNQSTMSPDDQESRFRSIFLIRTKSQHRLTKGRPGKGQTHKGLGYCLISLYIFLLKNNNVDLDTAP